MCALHIFMWWTPDPIAWYQLQQDPEITTDRYAHLYPSQWAMVDAVTVALDREAAECTVTMLRSWEMSTCCWKL